MINPKYIKITKIYFVLLLFGKMVLMAQFPLIKAPNLVHTNRALAESDHRQGKLWKSISFMVDVSARKITLQGSGAIIPTPQNENQSTLVLEYITISGKSFRVPATTPWKNRSGAVVPTDEDGALFRVYSSDGDLIGEYRDGPLPGKSVVAYDLTRLDEDKLGFHHQGRHIKMEAQEGSKVPRYFSPTPQCSLRWSWDGGQTWTKPDHVRGDDAITWALTPEIRERLNQIPNPLMEVLHSVGLKLVRKTYQFRDLPTVKNEAGLEKP